MSKAWRIFLWAAGILLAAGIVLGGAGWLTGASLPRMADVLYGGTDEARAAAQAALERGADALRSVASLFSSLVASLFG